MVRGSDGRGTPGTALLLSVLWECTVGRSHLCLKQICGLWNVIFCILSYPMFFWSVCFVLYNFLLGSSHYAYIIHVILFSVFVVLV